MSNRPFLQRLRPARARPRMLLALFLLRALVPVGYMPVALADGGPFALCHGTSAQTLALLEQLQADAAGEHQHGHAPAEAQPAVPADDVHHDLWDRCPLGLGASDAPLAHPFELTIPDPESLPGPWFVEAIPPVATASVYRARGPPVPPFALIN